jgi:hypothetical protein
MTACDAPATRAEIERHFAGRISLAGERHLREHLAGCSDCRAYYDRHLLLAEIDRARAMPPEDRLAVGLGLAKPRDSVRGPLLGGLAVAAAAAFVAIAAPSFWPRHGEFASRGAVHEVPGAELYVYRIGPTGSPERTDDTRMGRRDELAFAYTNAKGWPYLLVFGVDEHGHVYWYHPGWQNAAETPRAVAIQSGRDERELPDATSHDLDGAQLHVFGLFSRTALSVRDVEARILGRAVGPAPRALAEKDVSAAFPDGYVTELVLRVEGP